MEKKQKKFYKIVICKLTVFEFEHDRYSKPSKEYFRYGYSKEDVINKLRRRFKMNMRTKLIECPDLKSPYEPEDFAGSIYKHYDDSFGDCAVYYVWYIEETIRTKPIQKITIFETLNDD